MEGGESHVQSQHGMNVGTLDASGLAVCWYVLRYVMCLSASVICAPPGVGAS